MGKTVAELRQGRLETIETLLVNLRQIVEPIQLNIVQLEAEKEHHLFCLAQDAERERGRDAG